ncbi:MAG: hypothetical protein QF382_06280, partial [Acidimicrobiales bacterium]|nr:hypothetical protein [Acidimicrobiales bacterium]
MIQVDTTPYGADAHRALAAEIARLKGGDPLRPVSVVVSSNPIGIAARRALGHAGGIAAVTFLTPYRLAELLGATAIASTGRRPLSTPVLAGAVRAVLADEPGHFGGVASHPATERSLVRSHRTLSEVGPTGLERLAATSPRTADVVRVHRAVSERLRPKFSDEQDLVRAAVDAIPTSPPVLTDLGPTILFLPQRLSSGQAHLLQAIAEHHHLSVIAGITGSAEADSAVQRSVESIGGTWPSGPTVVPAIADHALSVSDADDEVRHALRLVIDAARRSTPLGRIAVLYGTRDPYARLIGDALDAADIPWFGSSIRTADTSLLGRSLLALLALPDHDLSRHDVTAWLAGAPEGASTPTRPRSQQPPVGLWVDVESEWAHGVVRTGAARRDEPSPTRGDKSRGPRSGSDCLQDAPKTAVFWFTASKFENSASEPPPRPHPSVDLSPASSTCPSPILPPHPLVPSSRPEAVLLSRSRTPFAAAPIAGPTRPVPTPHFAQVPTRPR